jgi:hypothetical protein
VSESGSASAPDREDRGADRKRKGEADAGTEAGVVPIEALVCLQVPCTTVTCAFTIVAVSRSS